MHARVTQVALQSRTHFDASEYAHNAAVEEVRRIAARVEELEAEVESCSPVQLPTVDFSGVGPPAV